MTLRLRSVCTLILTFALASISLSQAVPVTASPPRQTFDSALVERATVYIMQMYTNSAGQAIVSCIGSGTLVSANGLILTNNHLVTPSETCRSDRIAIGLTVQAGDPPVAKYFADKIEANVGWDLAVLRISTNIDGRPVDRSTLSLPFVEIGDSEATNLDDTIDVVGYVVPDEKNSGAADIVRGAITGYTAEALVGDRAWIKTNAVIPGGMSGGGVYNTSGQLIAVPTIEPARTTAGAVQCRHIQDSNGDGRVDNQDTCIPVSGFVNSLRPSRLARGLVLAAQLGIQSSIQPATQPEPTPTASPTLSRLFFAPGVNGAGMPTSVVTSAATGTTQLYLYFDYDNMVDGMIYELRTTIDGIPNPTFSLAPATWSGGQSGLWYIGSTAQQWPNGTYDFTLFVEGVRIANKQITVGGGAAQTAIFSDILFGVLNSDNQLVGTGNVLPVNNTINAQFVFNNMQPDIQWQARWYYDGLQVTQSAAAAWSQGPNGTATVNASGSAAQPLQPGRYRLELYMGDTLAATADFVMAGGQQTTKTDIFDNLSFATAVQDGKPGGVTGATFSTSPASLFATFDWRDLAPGTPWTWQWTVDSNPLFAVTQPWEDDSSGTTSWLRLDGPGKLPDGSYQLQLLIGGVVMAQATAKVGLGQLPVNTFGTAAGVQIQGKITDAETGQGIAGVSFIVLKPGTGTKDFTWTMDEIFDMSLSDSQGNFSLDRLLPRGQTYSIIVTAQGYLSASTDDLELDAKTVNPLAINIELNRD